MESLSSIVLISLIVADATVFNLIERIETLFQGFLYFIVIIIIILLAHTHILPRKTRFCRGYRIIRKKLLGISSEDETIFFVPFRIAYRIYSDFRWQYLSIIKTVSILSRFKPLSNYLMRIYISDLCDRDKTVIMDYREDSWSLIRNTRERKYREILSLSIIEYGINIKRFSKVFSGNKNEIYNSIAFKHVVNEVYVSDLHVTDLGEIECEVEFVENDSHHILRNAVLMWDSNVQAENAYKNTGLIPKYGELAHIPPKIRKSDVPGFGKIFTKIHYDDVEFLWFQHESLWPPSIDTFVMMEKLRQSTQLLSASIPVVVDIGTGTGALGIWLASKNHSVSQLYMSDWLCTPLFLARVNAEMNRKKTNLRDIQIGVALNSRMNFDIYDESFKTKDKADVLLCNPPYLPIWKNFRELGQVQTTMGTELLTEIIIESLDYSKRSFVNYSALVQPEVDEAIHGKSIELIKLGEPVLVPFRVPIALSNLEYLSALIEERGLEVIPKDPHGHYFWHYINTYEIVATGGQY